MGDFFWGGGGGEGRTISKDPPLPSKHTKYYNIYSIA